MENVRCEDCDHFPGPGQTCQAANVRMTDEVVRYASPCEYFEGVPSCFDVVTEMASDEFADVQTMVSAATAAEIVAFLLVSPLFVALTVVGLACRILSACLIFGVAWVARPFEKEEA